MSALPFAILFDARKNVLLADQVIQLAPTLAVTLESLDAKFVS